MRLLSRSTDRNHIHLTHFNNDDDVPPYSILSHTWIEGQEITYQDLITGSGKERSGYTKIQFCVDKAAEDGIQYCWVDTCCIDKSTSDEISTAINSMFRWYQRAVKCYVFLSDVNTFGKNTDSQASITWESAFRRSRWFTRGWTLQELLAPRIVEFFSDDGTRLGDKSTLEREIHQVTKIPLAALRTQTHLSEFSIDERMSWVARRKTSKKEDKAYCLLGILGVFLPLIHGEGEDHAFQRLREEAEKRQTTQRNSISPREMTDSSTLPCSGNEAFSASRLIGIADGGDVPTGKKPSSLDLVLMHQVVENMYEDDSTRTENCSIFDRYIGSHDHIGLLPQSSMYVTEPKELFRAGGPKVHEKIWSEVPDSRNALRSPDIVAYGLSKHGMPLQKRTLPQTSSRTKKAPSIKGPFPIAPKRWSPTEDQMLIGVVKSGPKLDWETIAKSIPNRSSWACEKRYEKLTKNGLSMIHAR